MTPRSGFLLAFLLIATPAGADPLRFEQLPGERVRLLLPDELGASWQQANVARLRLRSLAGQAAFDRQFLPAAPELELRLATPGCSLLELDVGPPERAGRADAWQRATRCVKLARCTADSVWIERLRAGPLITAKTGSRIEIRPLFNPLVLRPGADLPVRLYVAGEARGQAEVTASGPAGQEVRAVSDRVGIATLRIGGTGSWRLQFEADGATAELIFDVRQE